MNARLAFTLFALLAATPLSAKAPALTVRTGESWLFSIKGGQPTLAKKVAAAAKPGPGQVLVTVRSMMGTTMTITNNNRQAYTYKAELIGTDKPVPTRSCTLPADNRLSFENWPQKATAVRLSNFKQAKRDGTCP
jgi:hypothetical protein